MRIFYLFIVLCLTISIIHSATSPPVWPDTFSQDYVVSDSTTTTHGVGKIWYDFKNNRQRIDLSNSWFDYVCNALSPRTNTTCLSINVNDYLYYWLPDQSKCCRCCAAKYGCTIKPKDWLKNYQYAGTAVLSGETFDHWKVGNPRINQSYYSTIDQKRIPRRMQSGTLILDYIMNSYSEKVIDANVFALPDYCSNRCPQQTFCAQID